MGRVREKKRREEKKKEDQKEKVSEERRSSEKVEKSRNRNTVFLIFNLFFRFSSLQICGSGGSKSRLANAAGAKPAGQIRDEKLHVVVARSTFPSQNVKKHQVRSTF
jgi:hypothetical protein